MADNDIVHRGYMYVIRNPRNGVLGKVMTVTSRRYWVVLRKDSSRGGKRCIQLYRNEEHRGEPTRTFFLDKQSLKSVQKVEAKKAFVLNLKDEVCMFQCASRADMDDWYRDVQKYLVSGQPSRGATDIVQGSPEGQIYEVVPDDETFHVRLRRSSTLTFSGPCILEILKDFERNLFHIAVFTDDGVPRLVVKWQIDHIRQYGSNQMAFKFESGRKSPTGVDWFIVDTDRGSAVKIHKAVDYWAKHIVENAQNTGRPRRDTLPTPHSQRNGSLSSPPAMDIRSSQSLPKDSTLYMPLTGTRQERTVYATPDADGPKKNAKLPPRSPLSTNASGNRSTYQPLQPTASDAYVGDNTYQGISPRTVDPRNVAARRNPQPPMNETYMGLNARTRDSVESQQYMDLKHSRPK